MRHPFAVVPFLIAACAPKAPSVGASTTASAEVSEVSNGSLHSDMLEAYRNGDMPAALALHQRLLAAHVNAEHQADVQAYGLVMAPIGAWPSTAIRVDDWVAGLPRSFADGLHIVALAQLERSESTHMLRALSDDAALYDRHSAAVTVLVSGVDDADFVQAAVAEYPKSFTVGTIDGEHAGELIRLEPDGHILVLRDGAIAWAGAASDFSHTTLAGVLANPLPEPDGPSPWGAMEEQTGEEIYASWCAACHQPDGSGFSGPSAMTGFPALSGAADRLGDCATSIQRLDPQHAPNPALSLHGAHWAGLDDADLAEVISYVRSSWGNDLDGCTAEDVAAQR